MMLGLREDSEKQLQAEYQRALEENRDMVVSMQRQMQQLNQFLAEKKDIGDANARITAELDIKSQQLTRTEQTLEEERQVIADLKADQEKKENHILLIEGLNRQLKLDIEEYNLKIDEMRRVKQTIEDEVADLRGKQ